MDKFLIVGLGNPGAEYDHTRHNTGFMVVDELAKSVGATFEDKRYGFVAETSLKGRKMFILKPTTYMNLSGNAVRYWLQKENIDQTRLLVVVDDLSIPLGDFRLKGNGSNGGHNGLGNIQQLIGQQYARLRMGIGADFQRGAQVDWVLGKYSAEDMQTLQPSIDLAVEIIKSFVPQDKVFGLMTYGGKNKWYGKDIDGICRMRQAIFMGVYGCPGFDTWGPFKLTGGVQKGHPTAEEIKGAVDFFDKIEDEYGDIIVEEYAKREKRLAYEKEHPAGGLVAGVKRTAKKIANKL